MANRSRGKWDIVLEASDVILGYQLAEPSVPFEHTPGRVDEVVRNADIPRTIDSLDAGMGFSRRVTGSEQGYAYALPGYTRQPGGIFCPAGKLTPITLPPGPGTPGGWEPGPIRDSIYFDGTLFLLTQSNYVLEVGSGGSTAVVGNRFPGAAGSFDASWGCVFNNRIYFAGGSGMAYKDAGGGYSGIYAVPRLHVQTVNWRPLGVPTDMMIGTSPQNNWSSVRWCPLALDPLVDANWSAPVPVGQDRHLSITRIVVAPRHAYFYRPDGVYDMDELGTRAFNIAPWLPSNVGLNGAWGMHVGQGLYYTHASGLAYLPTEGEAQYHPEWAQPGWGLPFEGPVRGTPFAGALHNGWGLVALHDYAPPAGVGAASQAYVCAGRRDPQAAWGQATHVWHGAEAVVPGQPTHMNVHTTTFNGWPRLLICTMDATTTPPTIRAWWQSLPRIGTPLQEMLLGGQFEPADAASLFLPADPWDRPSAVKTLLQMDMVTERLNSGSDVLKAYASADEETTWTDYGTADDGQYWSMAPTTTAAGRFIRTRIDAVGHPILRSLELRSALGVELREARRYTVILAWDNALKGARVRETADPVRRMADLQSLLGRVCTLDDVTRPGTARVRVLQVLPGTRVPLGGAARAGAAGTEGAWAITAEVTVSFLDRPFRWDRVSEDMLDRDRQWV